MQTVQKEESVRLGNGVLKINNINVGLLKDAGVEVENVTAQIKAHNGKLPPRQKINSVKFKATMIEFNLENIKKVFGWSLTTVPEDSSAGTLKRKVLTYDDLIRAIEMYPIEFVNTNADGKKFGIKIFKGYATNSMSFNFPDDEDLEATIELPIEFGAYPDENNKYFEIFDEQDVA